MVVDELPGPQSTSFVMESHQLCYYVLGLVHSIWSPIPGALKVGWRLVFVASMGCIGTVIQP